MNNIDVFSVRDLRIHSGTLLKDAENGQISLITKHGKPAILALPFDEQLLKIGINMDLAIKLFENRLITLSKAAKIASLSMEEFIDLMQETGISVVDYSPDDLDDEMKVPI
ncbi:MAG: type II toxin-antitoxin system prevent-host-death family antitoxin [Spirochaetales bacterium]|nr:type II toxin-antitoxin system prevent-host-death family antitoxin [Spirochaetales bacterium]